jgi:hypothetical protein
MKINVTFLQSGESPDFGVFTEGETRPMDKDTAELLKTRGVVDFPNPKPETRNSKQTKED